MWKIIGESIEGTSHRRTELPCQDAHRFVTFDVAGERVLLAICSDGAGSAELSQVGSRIACERFAELCYGALGEADPDGDGAALQRLGGAQILAWYEAVRAEIAAEAESRQVSVRQLACTLLTAIVTEERAWFAQVGDGCIVYRRGDGYESAFWPQTGEYANMTNFVTQDRLEEVFELVELELRVDELAVFTDGLQRLALDFSRRVVHRQFFAPMFASLREAEFADELVVPLRGFLDSPGVNERTDDDKTLVLATRLASEAAR